MRSIRARTALLEVGDQGVDVLDVLLENSVSEAYLNEGVEILNGTKTPEQAMADIHDVAVAAKAKLGK